MVAIPNANADLNPLLSIIVIAHNEEKMLPLCLDSLMGLDYPKDKLEIVVVDNNSTDRTKDIIKKYPVKYAFEKKKGRASARTKGIKEASGKFIAFIDADCIADKNWIKNLVKGFTGDDIGGCGGKTLAYQLKTWVQKYIDSLEIYSHKYALDKAICSLPFLFTNNAIFRFDVLDKVGLFDELFYVGEDVDISWRILLKGYRFKYISNAIVYHAYRTNLLSFCKQIFEWGDIHALLIKKYRNMIKTNSKQFLSFVSFKSNYNVKNFVPFFINLPYFFGKIYGLLRLKFIKKRDFVPLPPSNKIIWWRNNSSINIFKPGVGIYYTLEGTGAKMYELFMKGHKQEEITHSIVNEYNVTLEEAKDDFLSLTKELRENEILQ